MAATRLTTNRWVPPGSYLGRKTTPRPGTPILNPRKVCFVGRGSRYKVLRNVGVTRAFVYDEQVFFPVAPPYRAQLQHLCDGNQSVATLKLGSGDLVAAVHWRLENVVDPLTGLITASYIIVEPNAYSPQQTYLLSYQSMDPDVLDKLPFYPNDTGMEMRSVLALGNEPGQAQYKEDLLQYTDAQRGDYRVVMNYVPPYDATDYAPARNVLADKYAMVPTPGYDDTPPRTEFDVDIDYHRVGYYTFACTNIVTIGLVTTVTLDVTVPGSATVQTLNLAYTAVDDPSPAVIDSQLTWNSTRTVLATFRDAISIANWVGAGTQMVPAEVAPTVPVAGIYSLLVTTNDGSGNLVIQVTPPGGAPVYSVGTAYNPVDPPGTPVPVVIAPGLLDINLTVGEVLTWVAGVEAWDIELPTYFQVQVQNWGVLGYHMAGSPLALDWSYTAKDTRTVTMLLSPIGSIVHDDPLDPTSPVKYVQFTYSSTTQEGGFGSITVARDPIVWAALRALGVPDLAEGDFTKFFFKDGIEMVITNPNSLVLGEKWLFTITNEHQIDWSPLAKRTETFAPDQIFTDTLGTITGTPGAPYLILDNVPMQFAPLDPRNLTIVDDLSMPVSYVIPNPDTADVRLTSYATGRTLTATYYTRGHEPQWGSVYYGTFTVTRPSSDYNTVQTAYSPDDAADQLGPMAVSNHLDIMQDLVYAQDYVPQAISWVQIYDEDQDGIYTTRDFYNGLQAVRRAGPDITDVVVLGHFDSLPDMKSTVIFRNDPFQKRLCLGWQGMPAIHFLKGSGQGIGTADDKDAGSIVYTAMKALQTYNESPGRGSFIEIANTWAKHTVVTEDNIQVQVMLDGSFLAGIAASIVTAFARPEETIIKKAVRGLDAIDQFDDSEILRVGAASTTYIIANGTDYIFGESVTVDLGEPALNEISGRTQEQFVVRYVNGQVDQNLVGFVPEDAPTGAAIVQSFIAGAIGQLLGMNYISNFLDPNTGTVREFDPNADVIAEFDANDPRIYYFNFFFFLRYPGKRFMGLYSVDRNLFLNQNANA